MTAITLNLTSGAPFVPYGGKWRMLAALTSQHGGKRVFIEAYYLNNYPLVGEDGEEDRRTGWFFLTEVDGDKIYERINWGTIDLWTEWPIYTADMAPSGSEVKEKTDE